MATKKKAPTWSELKRKLTDLDRADLLGLLQDLYAASKDNQHFLHARFALGDSSSRTLPSPKPRRRLPIIKRLWGMPKVWLN
jgi:hypothetical protein